MDLTLKFGTLLRATRLGFTYVPRWNGFIRGSDKGKHSLIELRPNEVKELKGAKEYRRIDDPEKLISLSPALSKIVSIDTPLDLILDDNGLEV